MLHSGFTCCISSVYRMVRLFFCNQSHIRSHLFRVLKPPDEPNQYNNPLRLTILHLKEFSKNECCPITKFQQVFQTPFLYCKEAPRPL
jgi:hypothetical protein